MVPATTLTTIATVSEPHALPASEVVARLDVAPAVGLDDEEVEAPPQRLRTKRIVARRRSARSPCWRTSS